MSLKTYSRSLISRWGSWTLRNPFVVLLIIGLQKYVIMYPLTYLCMCIS